MKHLAFYYWRSMLRSGFAILLFSIASLAHSQEMPRSVIGSAGDYYEHLLFGNIHWTVGEVAVSRFQNGMELSEGFHQSYYNLVVKTQEPARADWDISLYPNPTADILQLRLPVGEQLTARLFSSTGQLLRTEEGIQEQHQMNLIALPAGLYWLHLIAEDGRYQSYQVQKIR